VSLVCKYIALHVPDLRSAEHFYRRAFGMEVQFREAERDGVWWTLSADTGWEAANAAGVEPGMVALRRDDLVLALFLGTPRLGTVYEICLGLPSDEVEGLVSRVADDVSILEREDGFVRFEDPFGFRWVLQEHGAAFRSSGEIAGRWLDV
jgi:catechol 2,3-dioxygenase-like lactoylglutathione lyase family enzyme